MIGGIMKSYPQLTWDNILYDMSIQNLLLLSSIIPTYNSNDESSKNGKQKGISNQDFFIQMKNYGKA